MISKKDFSIAFFAYFIWGIFPIYWRWLHSVPPIEVLCHRVIWSFLFYILIYRFSGKKSWNFLKVSARNWQLLTLAGLLLSLNWGFYIYAVNNNRILEGSLAYFLNPLLNVLVGVLFFKEKFPWQLKSAVLLAVAGVAVQFLFSATIPWIALILATSFCTYGVLKKMVKLPVSESSILESLVMLLPAIAWAFVLRVDAQSPPFTTQEILLLVGSGVVTGFPLFLFSLSMQRLPLSLMGMLQFVAPTLQFLVGVLLYGEIFDRPRQISFLMIWIGVAIYLYYQLTHRVKNLMKNLRRIESQ